MNSWLFVYATLGKTAVVDAFFVIVSLFTRVGNDSKLDIE